MGIFGWSLPPGCGTLPGEEEYPCEVCGGNPENPDEPGKVSETGGCICPECPVCGEFGNPDCYTDGHLQMTQAQAEQKIKFEIAMAEDADYEILPDDITDEDILC